MSLDHAILGFLQYGPLSGYDLKARFDLSVRHFWPADQSQIYRVLAKLDEQGYVGMKVVEQESRPDRKVYSITQAGREELHRWLATPLEMDKGRQALLVQIFFSGQLSDEEILAIFRRMAAKCQDALSELQNVPARASEFTQQVPDDREKFCWFLTLECGIRMTEANLAWMEDVIARIGRGELPPMHKANQGKEENP